MYKKFTELLILMQKKNFSKTDFNQVHHWMQREKLHNLHMIARFIALLFLSKTYEVWVILFRPLKTTIFSYKIPSIFQCCILSLFDIYQKQNRPPDAAWKARQSRFDSAFSTHALLCLDSTKLWKTRSRSCEKCSV